MPPVQPSAPPRYRLRRPLSAWLAGVVLLANLLVGGLAPAAWGEGMVVCTADGMQVVGPDGQARPAAGDDHGVCLLCLPLALGGSDLPPQGYAVAPPPPVLRAAWPTGETPALRPRPAASPGLARAPPSA